jgi:O-glycosyl hydrolase
VALPVSKFSIAIPRPRICMIEGCMARRRLKAFVRCFVARASRPCHASPDTGGTPVLRSTSPTIYVISFIGAVAPLLLSLRVAGAATGPIVIDPAARLQTFEGWGTSLCWWAKVAGGYPPADRERIMDQVFDPAAGLGFNVVRYNIGGGENPADHFLSFRAAVPGYEPGPGKWDWTADANQRWVLQAAIRRGADQIEAFSNSPPWWMTRSQSVTGNDGGTENLPPDQAPAFAQYLAAVVRHFHDAWHVDFRDVDPLNEPCSGWWTKGKWQEGCRFDRPSQSRVIELLAADLKRSGLKTTVAASDENSVDDAVTSFDALTPAARSAVSKINTHSYNGTRRGELHQRAVDAGKDLWMSEYGDDDPTGLQMADRIVLDMRQLRPTAWVIWQVADPAGGWGLFRSPLRDETHTDWKTNEKFHVMGNFSRFIRPGAVMLEVADAHTIAGYNPGTHSLALVVVNSSKDDRTIVFDVAKMKSASVTARVWRTGPAENLAAVPEIGIRAGRLSVTLPPHTVVTVVVGGCVVRS